MSYSTNVPKCGIFGQVNCEDMLQTRSSRSRDIMQHMRRNPKVFSIALCITTAIGLFIFVVSSDLILSQSAAPYLNFSHPHYNIGEADGSGVITVALDSQLSYTITVDFESFDQTALAGIDYVETSGTLTFTPGITRETFTIDIIKKGFF